MSALTQQPNAKLTGQIINPVLTSVIETFESMLSSQVERGAVSLRQPDELLYAVSALIGVSGQARGAVCLSFEKQTAFGVVERFLGEKPAELNSDVFDALGELVNMVGGGAKSKMNMGLNLGLPNVVHGVDCQVEFPSDSKPMRVHFDSDIGPFLVDFGFVVRQM